MIGSVVDRVLCINLDRRLDRWQSVQDEIDIQPWPFPTPERFRAVDWQSCDKPPEWWDPARPESRHGAWACYQSHRAALTEADESGCQTVLILEDDMFLCPSFADRYAMFAAAVPDGWEQVYLGGNVRDCGSPATPPTPAVVNEHVIQPAWVLATHAYLLTRPAIHRVLRQLRDERFLRNAKRHAIDRLFVEMHRSGILRPYAPRHRWLMGQIGGWSDIGQEDIGDPRYWNSELLAGAC